jgi:hypothetical protein
MNATNRPEPKVTQKKMSLKRDTVRELGGAQQGNAQGAHQFSHYTCTIICHQSGTGHLCC